MSFPLPQWVSDLVVSTALDTPQVLVTPTYQSETVTLGTLRLRRSEIRYPMTETDETFIADYTTPFPTEVADSSVDADKVYYYSLFGQYYGPVCTTLDFFFPATRYHDTALGMHPDTTAAGYYWLVGRGGDGYSAFRFDSARGYVDTRIDIPSPDSPIVCSMDVREYPVASGHTVVFVLTRRHVIGYYNGEEVYRVTISGVTNPTWAGGCIEWAAGIPITLYLLNSATSMVHPVDPATGAVLASISIAASESIMSGGAPFSGICISRDGLSYLIGSGRRVMRVNPVTGAPQEYTPTRTIPFAFCEVQVGGIDRTLVYDQSYSKEVQQYRSTIHQLFLAEGFDVDTLTACLFHLESAPAGITPDAVVGNPGGTLVGASVISTGGKFGENCLSSLSDSVDISASLAVLPQDEGAVDFWIKAPSTAHWAGLHYLFHFSDAVVANSIHIEVNAGNFLARRISGGVPVDVVVPTPTDTEWHHINYQYSVIGNFHRLSIDGGAPVSVAGVLPMAAAWVHAEFAGSLPNPLDFWGGLLDEFRVSSTPGRTWFTPYTLWRKQGEGFSLSGSDHTTGYPYRENLPTRTFIPGRVLENDSHPYQSMGNLTLSSGELVRRNWPVQDVGDTYRLIRLIGAMLDAVKDLSKATLPADCNTCAPDVLNGQAFFLGLRLDEILNPRNLETYPLNKQRTFLRLLSWMYEKIGDLDALRVLLHYYQVRTWGTDSLARARCHFDSGVPFDSGIRLDSWSALGRASRLDLSLFDDANVLEAQTDGATSIPANKRLTSALANFSGVRAGDMVRLLDSSDLGDYLVDTVVGPNDLDVTQSWPAGLQAGVSFRVIPKVPAVDPIATYLRKQADKFTPSSLEIVLT